MRQTIKKQQKFYFSDKVKEQLRQISQYPLTIVEAPSGFGKTTAIKEYLRHQLPQGAAWGWYTCLGEPASIAWEGICEEFARINSKVADEMKRLKLPTMDTLFYMAAYLKNLKCRGVTYFVIDNYQLIHFDMHRELMDVFSMHESPNLHMIFITQPLDSRQQLRVHNNNIHRMDASTFLFDKKGIATLFRMEGLRLAQDQLEKIFKSTEGWISPIRLQMIHYKKTGSFVCSAGIEPLVETAIWSRLMPTEKDFLLRVSVFDSFTAGQAAGMLEDEILPGKIEEDLKTSDFIRFLPEKRLFIIHSILLDYLRNRFYHHRPKEYQNQIFYKAGMSCAAMGKYCRAAEFFYRIRDFDAILSLPFTRPDLEAQKEECKAELFMDILRECPEEILSKHPFTMVAFGHYALLNGQYEIYAKLCRLLRLLVQGKTRLTQAEIRRLKGELTLLETMGAFNDLSKMQEGYKTASEILKEPSDSIENTMPWFSVFSTAFGMFWRESGKLDRMLDTMNEIKPVYYRLSRGQGAGLSYLMRAEVMLVRGEDNQGEILCHKSLYEARTYGQISICIYAELILARIFILRGDSEQFFTAIKNIQGYAEEASDFAIHRMVDLCMSIISLLLGIKDYVAPWLYNIEDIGKLLHAPVIPFGKILYGGLLLMDKRYNELYAFSQIALDTLRNPEAKVQYLMPQMYHLIFLAVAKHYSGNGLEAQRYLKEALDIALPDQVYLPFTDHDCMASLLFRENIGYDEGENRPIRRQNSCTAFMALCERQQKGVKVIKRNLLRNKSPLTPREREIALLAKDRLSAKEIGIRLYISESTVKTTLRNVYRKLDIHSRRELVSIEI